MTALEHATLNDANHAGLYAVTSELDVLRMWPGTLPGDLPTRMGSAELGANIFQRTQTAEFVRQRELEGISDIAATAEDVGVHIRLLLESMGGIMPEAMPQYPPLIPGEWMPIDHPSLIQWDAATDRATPDDEAGEDS